MAANIGADNAANLTAKEVDGDGGADTAASGINGFADLSGDAHSGGEVVADGDFGETAAYDPNKIGLPDDK